MSMKYRFGIVFALLLSIAACSSVSTPPSSPALPAPTTIEEGFLQQKVVWVEAGIPLFNWIPYLNRLFSHHQTVQCLSNHYVWEDSEFPPFNSSAAISSDGKWLLVGKLNGGGVSLWNLYDPRDCHLDIVPSMGDGAFTISADGAVSYDAGEVTDKSQNPPVFDPGKKGTTAAWLRFTPDASAFLVFRRRQEPSEMETMTLHDRTSRQKLREIPIEPKFQAGTISADGELLLAVGATSLEYWNLRSGQKVASASLGNLGDVTDIQCTQDQRFLFLTSSAGLHIFDFYSLRKINSDPDKLHSCVAISPNGQTLAVVFSSLQSEGRIQIYEIGTWQLLREIRPKNKDLFELNFVRFSRDGKSLLALASSIHERKTVSLCKNGLFGYDLDQPNGSWQEIEYKTLPLHPEGKYLLNGQFGSADYLSPFMERMGIDFEMRFGNDNEK